MFLWKNLWWIVCAIQTIWYQTQACLDKEQFIAGLDPKTTLVFEAELLQFGQTDDTEAYVRVTHIIRQPETGWHLQPGNVAHLTGIQPRVTDPSDCLPSRNTGTVYLWITSNSAVSLHNAEYSLKLIPGGLFPSMDYSNKPHEQLDVERQEKQSSDTNMNSISSPKQSVLVHNQIQGPCATVQCHFGAVCETWPSPSTEQLVGVCVCPQLDVLNRRGLCNAQSGPVCAHNGHLYDNECAVALAVCVQQSHLEQIELPPSDGSTLGDLCEQLTGDRTKSRKVEAPPNPSTSTVQNWTTPASFSEQHKDFEDRPQQDSAASYQSFASGQQEKFMDNRHSTNRCDTLPCSNTLSPVCGTDGVTYLNECLLRQRSCLAILSGRPPIRISYASHCISRKTSVKGQPDAVLCSGNNVCLFGGLCPVQRSKGSRDQSTIAIRMWFGQCSCEHINCLGRGPDPVCANDGQTYSNECFLHRRVCETQTPRQVLYRGNCASNPCLGYACRWAGERCQVDETGQPKCVCPQPCPNVVSPVCGSDRVTYDSHCHLERTACMKMRDIFILYAGQCSEEPHCESLGLQCQGYEICSRIPAPHVYDPRSAYQDAWSSLTSQSQPVQLVARCLCPTCPEKGIGEQVCGSDGQTYRSECHLRASACQRQLHQLTVRARGPCDACKTKECPYHAICRLNSLGDPECICPTDCLYVRKPVCGTDGKMYENECFLKVAACAEQREIHVAQEGPCATCPFGCPLGYQCLKGECVCRVACPKPTSMEAEVCGSDGQLYPSECELKRQACLSQINVRVDPSGAKCRDLAHRTHIGTVRARAGDGSRGEQIDESRLEAGYLAQPQSDQTIQSSCSCNKIGALSEHCDYRGRCHCKWGVRGERCDQCMPDYWGIQNGHECIACSCHPDGSLNTTCDPMTGQCNCRKGIFGRQCSICPEGGRLSKAGCIKEGVLQDPVLDVIEPERPDPQKSGNPEIMQLNGRRFTPETTLLVRAPFPLKEPFTVQLVFYATTPNGTLLYYQLAPSKQEQMLLEHPTGRQFFLSIVNERIELQYVSDGPFGRTLSVRSSQKLQLGVQHTLRAGVSKGRPWIKLDTDPETTATDIEERGHEVNLDTSLSTGGHGTVVVGRQVRGSSSHFREPVAEGKNGFSGCLLQLVLQTESPPQEQDVDLISGDQTELAWIGVERLPSGLAEAPLCRATENPTQSYNHDTKQRVQFDATEDEIPSSNPCDRQPCLNGATCELTSSTGYTCTCLPGSQGHHCDQVATIVPQFHGDSFIRLPGPTGRQAMHRKRLHMEIVFLITEAEGMILLIPPSLRFANSNLGPFIGVYVDGKTYLYIVCRVGHPSEDETEFASKGQQNRLIVFRYSSQVKLNQWHTLIVEKRTRALIVQLDEGPKERIRTVPENFRRLPRLMRQQLTAFDLSESPIYVGGYSPNDPNIPAVPVRNGIKGALQKLNINGAEVVLAGPISSKSQQEESTSVTQTTELWFKVTQWQGPPCGPTHSPCPLDKPESVCRPQGSEAICACSTPLQLWQLLREKMGNLEDAERMACKQRKNELDKAHGKMLQDRPALDERMNEHAQHDALPSQNAELDSDSDDNEVVKTHQLSNSKANRCGALPIAFKGQTTMTFQGLIEDMEEYNLRLRLSTKSSDGLLLLISAQSGDVTSRFLQPLISDQPEITTIEIRQGFIEYSIHVPTEPNRLPGHHSGLINPAHQSGTRTVLRIRSDRTANDGLCHTIHIARSQRRATLITDHHMVSGEFEDTYRNYNPNNVVFLGGLSSNVTGFTGDYQNFTGCVGDVFVNEHNVQLLTSAIELRGPVEPCS